LITSIIEVFTLCGFVFGVACKLPPSLTILILNGCFCFPISYYLIYQANNYRCKGQAQEQRYLQISEQQSLKNRSKYLLTALELLGFLMQLGALVCIPVLLSENHFFTIRESKTLCYCYICFNPSLTLCYFYYMVWLDTNCDY